MTKKHSNLLIGIIVGVAASFAVHNVYASWQHSKQSMDPTTGPTQHQITAFKVADSWVKQGQPNFRATEFYRSADGKTTSGIFECDASVFEWHYDKDEAIYLLEGQVDIEYLGQKFTLTAGQSTFFKAGTVALWRVPGKLRKTWTMYEAGKPVKQLSKVFG